MKIHIGNFRIERRVDQWVVSKKTFTENRYYNTLGGALKNFVERSVSDLEEEYDLSNKEHVEAFRDAIEDLRRDIDEAVEDLKETLGIENL